VASHGGSIIVPAPILVEATTGQPRTDAELNRILRILLAEDEPAPANQDLCRLAGRLRHKAGSDDGIDALVAAAAVATNLPTVILTSDPLDLKKLVANHPKVRVSQI